MLKYIDETFCSSSFKVKFELYLLPLFIVYIFFYLFPVENKKIKLLSIPKIENIKFKGSYFDLIKDLENYSKINKLKVLNIKHSKNKIYFKVLIKKNAINKLIHKIESLNKFSTLESFSFFKNKEGFVFDSIINFKKYHIKKEEKEVKAKIIKRGKYKLKAIIDDYVLINNKWLKTGSKIDKYEIRILNKNTILLENEKKQINLKVYKDEKHSQL